MKDIKETPLYALGLYGAVGFQFAVSVVVCLFAGSWLDEKFNSTPLFVVAGAIFGTIAGIYNLAKILKWKDSKKNG